MAPTRLLHYTPALALARRWELPRQAGDSAHGGGGFDGAQDRLRHGLGGGDAERVDAGRASPSESAKTMSPSNMVLTG